MEKIDVRCLTKFHCLLASLLATLFLTTHAHAESLQGLHTSHPRLLLSRADIAHTRAAIAKDPYLRGRFQELTAAGEAMLQTSPDAYIIDGPEHTLLPTARDIENRIVTLSGLYLLTKRQEFASRAIQEMLATASFPDWFPSHFLGTAELTTALGLGYDWLYSVMTPDQRDQIRSAIVRKGLDPWLAMIHSGKQTTPFNNWVQVCNGGEVVGALAVADTYPERAREVLDYSKRMMTRIMTLFAPDGGFQEGPVYWTYATVYNVIYLSALETALGSDFGMAELPGFNRTGDYRIQSMGPNLRYANFADANEDAFAAPQMLWLARRFHRPEYASHERTVTAQGDDRRFQFLGLLWGALAGGPPKTPIALPHMTFFRGVNQAFLRSSWSKDAWYVGIKGGDNTIPHNHLDLGSFVLDADGERWASDLGPDSYGLPGYFGKRRWNYYRMRTEGHNTLLVNAHNQDLDATATITTTQHEADITANLNLSQAYKNDLDTWQRAITLRADKSVFVQDTVKPSRTVDLTWSLHTEALIEINIDGTEAVLRLNGHALVARISSPPQGRFTVQSSYAPKPQADNSRYSDLVIQLPQQDTSVLIGVTFNQAAE